MTPPSTPVAEAPTAGLDTHYSAVRDLTEALAAPLGPEDQTVQTMADVSPTKWHRAHTTWFFETFVLEAHQPGYRPVDEAYRFLFNSYYEAVGARHPRAERGHITRPTVDQVAAYRAEVDTSMEAVLSTDITDAVGALVTLGLHHEQQHQELLLMDIKHVLAANPLRPAYLASGPAAAPDPGPLRWVDRPGGRVEVGHAGPGFAYDNEGPRHEALLVPHRLGDRLVTNGEWRAFMDDGGYRRPELWLSDGWATVGAQRWEAPLYWEQVGDEWHEFTLAGRHAVDPARPVVHVSHFEADAYARWTGARLPTEQEWEAAVAAQPHVEPAFALDGPHPRSVAPTDGGPVRQAFGEVWQWTSSPYVGFPGFAPAVGAVGEYNGKFMSGQVVLRGSSCATPPAHARLTYRNFFPPTARWAFSGVRLAADA
ncbi:MAG TPA: ergothioneine biosynthesis protein EgtB [Acidimicrobiales bacterium]|nr:ergothioneine biosynthesis protein EgtB [Acidimicrobiales bacterium]